LPGAHDTSRRRCLHDPDVDQAILFERRTDGKAFDPWARLRLCGFHASNARCCGMNSKVHELSAALWIHAAIVSERQPIWKLRHGGFCQSIRDHFARERGCRSTGKYSAEPGELSDKV